MEDAKQCDILVIGAGPAGLAAAEIAGSAGWSVLVAEQKPSVGRKFLMAGKSGLNITKDTDPAGLVAAISPEAPQITAALQAWDADDVQRWAEGLGQPVFTGSSGRVFPKTMKASPLLRAWLGRLATLGVEIETNRRWLGTLGPVVTFATPDGPVGIKPSVVILAMGGASWSRLGSDGAWAKHLPIAPFRPANVGFTVDWSPQMGMHFGAAIKSVRLSAGDVEVKGEFVISRTGVEGSAIYALSATLREMEAPSLKIDLFPDMTAETLAARLAKPRNKASLSNHLRKTLRLQGARLALAYECLGSERTLPGLADHLKSLHLRLGAPRPMEEAISTAGGLRLEDLNDALMLHAHPGTFAAGEMLDWEAPTGGYLITTCMATGRHAARGALEWLHNIGRA